MDRWLSLLVLGLAVYRVAHMLAREEGPWSVFARWRYRVGQTSWVGRGFQCPLCLSFWLAWLGALLLPWPGLAWYAAEALAISGVTLVLFRE